MYRYIVRTAYRVRKGNVLFREGVRPSAGEAIHDAMRAVEEAQRV